MENLQSAVALQPGQDPPTGMLPDGSFAFYCRWCGQYSIMQPDEVQWYVNQGFVMPARCIRCRRKRRGIMQGRAMVPGAVL